MHAVSTNPPAGNAPVPSLPWIWFVLLGAVCTVLGIIGMVDVSVMLTLTDYGVLFFGIWIAIAGAASIIGAFFVRPWFNSAIQILSGMLYLVAGAFVCALPDKAEILLTLLLAISFIISGALRVIVAFRHRQAFSWIFLAFGGLITMLVGIYIFRRWPWDSAWVIGLFIAIDLFVQGVSWLALGFNLRIVDRAMRAGLPVEFNKRSDDTMS
jgi:uncharacterized membrane protein HdeD (DUF308 family)